MGHTSQGSVRAHCGWLKQKGVYCGVLVPNPGIKPRSPALLVDSLPSEPPRKPKNTGMGSLSLLQGIFLAQELNLGPCIGSLGCRFTHSEFNTCLRYSLAV